MLPALALGAAGTLASMFLNNSAQNSVGSARNGVIQAERGRQAGFDAEAGKLNDQSLGRYFNFDTRMADRAASLADMFKAPVVTPNTPYTAAPLPAATPGIVQREIDAKNGIANAYVSNQGDKLANLRSFGDLFGGVQLDQAKDAQAVGQVGGFKKGSAGVEKLELDNANRAGNTAKLWADIAAGLGKVGLTAGLSGSFDPSGAGGIAGAVGPTSVGGAPLAAPLSQPLFKSPFLTYGR